MKEENYDRLRTMIYSMYTLQYKGISVQETVRMTLQNIMKWYQISEDERYLEMITIHLQAYVNMGHALNPEETQVRQALELLGRQAADFRPSEPFLGKKVRLTHSQVRSMLGKWRPTQQNPMTVNEVVEDIIRKVSEKQYGCYIYEYRRFAGKEVENGNIYELIVGEEESYFYDVMNFRFYILSQE